MIIYIIGIGLIGGSFALAMRDHYPGCRILGSDYFAQNLERAIELGLVDESAEFEQGVLAADLVVIAAPVDVAPTIAVKALNLADDLTTIIDVGSIKGELCEMISHHSRRGRFVATHPMWGTEFSGPDAAVRGAFAGCRVAICDRECSSTDALAMVEDIYRKFGMEPIFMHSEDHDLHTAYISHISHITSFALAMTVLEKEREQQHILDLASTGFASTVRLAKSSPKTWVPIILRNKYNVLDVLREHIHQLQLMRKAIERDDAQELTQMMQQANKITKILQ